MAQGWTLVQTAVPVGATSSSGSARTLSFTNNLVAGHFIWLEISTNSTSVTLTVSGSVNGSYVQAGSYQTISGRQISLWYKLSSSAGAETITITPSVSVYINAEAYEMAATVSALDSTATANATSATPNTGTITVSQADELLIGAVCYSSNPSAMTCSPNAGVYLGTVNNPTAGIFSVSFFGPASANASIGFAIGSGTWVGIGASFKAAASGGTGGMLVHPGMGGGARG